MLTPNRAMLDRGGRPGFGKDLFSHIDFSRGAVAAVSGGSDSTALLLLIKEHLDRAAPSAKLLAVTVDHGLRPGSAQEAQAVARLCATRGIAHRTMVWSGPKPASGLPAAAREARYRLLDEAAREAGVGLILTGHTADDQAETVLMRRTRTEAPGEGLGLAGMAPATLHGWRTWIVRPLLRMRRQALRDVLRHAGIGWADDPTNADQRFERPRIRKMLAGEVGETHFSEALALAASAAAAREALGRRAAKLVDAHAGRPAPGLFGIGAGFAATSDREAAVHALRILLATAGGVAFLPDEARAAALFARLGHGAFRATLSRTVVDARRVGVFLRREVRGLPTTLAADGDVWDGRRRITFDDGNGPMVIAPLGVSAARDAAKEVAGVPASLVRAALGAEPWPVGRIAGDAAFSAVPLPAPWAGFLPCFDLAPARAVARLIGAPPIPAPPFSRHNDARPWSKP